MVARVGVALLLLLITPNVLTAESDPVHSFLSHFISPSSAAAPSSLGPFLLLSLFFAMAERYSYVFFVDFVSKRRRFYLSCRCERTASKKVSSKKTTEENGEWKY